MKKTIADRNLLAITQESERETERQRERERERCEECGLFSSLQMPSETSIDSYKDMFKTISDAIMPDAIMPVSAKYRFHLPILVTFPPMAMYGMTSGAFMADHPQMQTA